jgi:hypothetical protein
MQVLILLKPLEVGRFRVRAGELGCGVFWNVVVQCHG